MATMPGARGRRLEALPLPGWDPVPVDRVGDDERIELAIPARSGALLRAV